MSNWQLLSQPVIVYAVIAFIFFNCLVYVVCKLLHVTVQTGCYHYISGRIKDALCAIENVVLIMIKVNWNYLFIKHINLLSEMWHSLIHFSQDDDHFVTCLWHPLGFCPFSRDFVNLMHTFFICWTKQSFFKVGKLVWFSTS